MLNPLVACVASQWDRTHSFAVPLVGRVANLWLHSNVFLRIWVVERVELGKEDAKKKHNYYVYLSRVFSKISNHRP